MSVEVETEGGVTVVTIARPERRNAVDPKAALQLFEAFVDFEQNSAAGAAILTGAGGFFCAGFDLNMVGSEEAKAWLSGLSIPSGWDDPMRQPLPGPMGPSRLMLSKPVIAAIEGPAVAGGMELAAWCDFRVMAADAVVGVFCRRWGVPLIDGGTVRLPRILGQGRASDLILTGRAVEAEEALSMGFANRLCPRGQALEVARSLALDLVRFPQVCLKADHLSARMSPDRLAQALRREWASAELTATESRIGAARFAAGKGRSGDFSDI